MDITTTPRTPNPRTTAPTATTNPEGVSEATTQAKAPRPCYTADKRTVGLLPCFSGWAGTNDPLGRNPEWVGDPVGMVNRHIARGWAVNHVRMPCGQIEQRQPAGQYPNDRLVPMALHGCLTPHQQKALAALQNFTVYGSVYENSSLDSIDMQTAAVPDMGDPAKLKHHADIHRAWKGQCPGYRGMVYDMGAWAGDDSSPRHREFVARMIAIDRLDNRQAIVEAIPCRQSGSRYLLDRALCCLWPSYALLEYLDARDPHRTWIVPEGCEVRIHLSIWSFGGYGVWSRPPADPQRRFAERAALQRATELWSRGFCFAVQEAALDPLVRQVTGE